MKKKVNFIGDFFDKDLIMPTFVEMARLSYD
jgi:hypothetical protein